jgi:hypothetical protein
MILQTEIKCVVKDETKNPYEKILAVGGIIENVRWEKPMKEVIKEIEEKQCLYFVSRYGNEVEVIVVTNRVGLKYIKTKSDDDTPKNLLTLPDCPF